MAPTADGPLTPAAARAMTQQIKGGLGDLRYELARLEGVIEKGLHTFVEVGAALLTIRDTGLYKVDHDTFEDYCRKRWDFTDRRARQLMDATEVVTQIGTTVPVTPANEAQARELAPLRDDPDEVRAAWAEAVEASDGAPTAEVVRAVVARRRPEPEMDRTRIEREQATVDSFVDHARSASPAVADAFSTAELARAVKRVRESFAHLDPSAAAAITPERDADEHLRWADQSAAWLDCYRAALQRRRMEAVR